MFDPRLIAGAFLGWSLGANDSANVFGAAVASKMVRWRTAALLIALFVLIGALLQGGGGFETYGGLAEQTARSAFIVSMTAALTVAVMTWAGVPVSTGQAVVGAIVGVGLAMGQGVSVGPLKKVVLCWIGTPIGAALLVLILYPLIGAILRRMKLHFLVYDRLMRTLLIVAGIYGAYSLGANNVANVTGVFYAAGSFGQGMSAKWMALLVGGFSIGFGALTYSRNIMNTVGRDIVRLDAFSAFIVVLSHGVVIHIFAMIGVPVSSSQAVVGGVIGIGLYKGGRTVRGKTLLKIFLGWLLTPTMSLGLGFAFQKMF